MFRQIIVILIVSVFSSEVYGSSPVADAGIDAPVVELVYAHPLTAAKEQAGARKQMNAKTGPRTNASAEVQYNGYKLPKFRPEYNIYPTGKGTPFYKYRTVQVAVPLIVAGGLLMGNDVAFRDMRNDYLDHDWRYHYDDYLQYSPAAIILGLKALGVKGRSSWGRMLSSSAFAFAGTLIMANGTKLLRLRERPDGADRRSFPSGHTATAFVTATILHKEYGTTLSPWFSVAGYTIAAGVGVSRVLNNKHWVSDILAGAGVGILAGELGYFIADKIFRDRGLLRPTSEAAPIDNLGRPSFVGLSGGGVILPLGRRGGRDQTYCGVSTGVHGAWFMNSRIGFGGQLSALSAWHRDRATHPGGDVAGNGDAANGGRLATGSNVSLAAVDIISAQAGVYISKTIGSRWLLSGKLLGGVSITRRSGRSGGAKSGPVGDISGGPNIGPVGDVTAANVYSLSFPDFTSFTATLGYAMTFVVNNHLGIRAYAELSGTRCRTMTTTISGDTILHIPETKTVFPLFLGISFDMLLW